MQITLSNNIETFSLPLPIYKSIHIADATKDGEEFSIFMGLDKELVSQLEKYSADLSDIDLQKYTGDKRRFVDGTYEDWYKTNRTSFALVDKKTGVMAAMVRFGPRLLFSLSEQGDNWHTAGWRSYNPWRGKGLMKDFAKFALDFYMQNFPCEKMWIHAKQQNTGSLKLASVLGFQPLKEENDDVYLVLKK